MLVSSLQAGSTFKMVYKNSLVNSGYCFWRLLMLFTGWVVSILKKSFSNLLTSSFTLISETLGSSELVQEANIEITIKQIINRINR